MRIKAYLIKTLKENVRDWKVLIFALAFAPCFVFILYGAYGQGNHSYNIIVINRDNSTGNSHSKAIISTLTDSKYDDGVNTYRLIFSNNIDESVKKLKNRTADAVMEMPENLTETLHQAAVNPGYTPTKLKLYGDPRNTRYAIASILLLTDFDNYVKDVTRTKMPVELDETLVGEGKTLTEFDYFVPGIIVLALLNVMFTAGASFIKEIEKGTIQRLVMSRLKTSEFICAVGIIQIILCVVSMLLALAAAMLCGFSFQGSYGALILVGVISGVGVVGFSLITVSFLKNVYDLMTVGVFPYFVVMFFAGIFFPLPPLEVMSFGENVIRLNDFLPLSLTVTAFNKILNFGAGIGDIGFEMAGVAFVSAVYLLIGLAAFRYRHMRLSS